MSSIDSAIARLQDIAAQLNTIPDAAGNIVTIKSAKDYPVENVEPFPCSIAYIAGGEFRLTNATIHHNFPVIAIEFHFSRTNLLQAYKQSDAVAIEFPQRLASDPKLGGTVDTIIATEGRPVPYTVRPFVWRDENPRIMSHMLRFDIPIKVLKAPIATT
jgi:hypothetical protein